MVIHNREVVMSCYHWSHVGECYTSIWKGWVIHNVPMENIKLVERHRILMSVCVCECVCMCMCVCVWEREKREISYNVIKYCLEIEEMSWSINHEPSVFKCRRVSSFECWYLVFSISWSRHQLTERLQTCMRYGTLVIWILYTHMQVHTSHCSIDCVCLQFTSWCIKVV